MLRLQIPSRDATFSFSFHLLPQVLGQSNPKNDDNSHSRENYELSIIVISEVEDMSSRESVRKERTARRDWSEEKKTRRDWGEAKRKKRKLLAKTVGPKIM